MVSRLTYPFILISLLLTMAGQAMAAKDLTVEPDRTRLYEGEVLTLTVKGSTKIDINLGNLFDFDMSSLPKPDIEKVEDDFEILARNQQYSIRTINNEMIGEITWTYQLAPKTTGKLTIPALKFRDSESDPVTVNVIDGTPPEVEADASRNSFIELAADKDEVYVQEQLVLTIKLFFTGNLIRGELSEPEHPHAIIESLGKQSEYTRYRDGVRYRVVERRYAIYPQKEGQLSLQPIRFEGQARNSDGQLKFLRDNATLFDVPVNGIPADFSGDTWLPARNLELNESGLPQSRTLTAGQNLTRTLTLQADGLPSETLPPFPEEMPDGIRAYPEKAERSTTPGSEGLASRLTQTTALVPVQPGQLVLPEIRIPWWDTKSDTERVAVVPARTLTIDAIPGQIETLPADSPNQATRAVEEEGGETKNTATGTAGPGFWPLATLTLLGIWVVTLAAWWLSRRKSRPETAAENPREIREKALFRELCEAARAGSPTTTELLVRWIAVQHPETTFRSVVDVNRFLQDKDLAAEIEQLQHRLFGTAEQQASAPWDGDRLVATLIRIRGASGSHSTEEPLPPLYPDGLRTSGN
ncbi:protein BatD [Marinobacter panjinensis]|uniref:Protein BatD n=1 Tax=Marinobacter panjinensis TaxID=2576384 RepID=A0A4U6R1N5_9GAMM|nr:BatD family protein [Marinobacter panjinensis]MCR8913834.1 BatD family protein [Marinobacter panjinensis]TKV67527.1 protein BatD [Marinobacter panjinensis]